MHQVLCYTQLPILTPDGMLPRLCVVVLEQERDRTEVASAEPRLARLDICGSRTQDEVACAGVEGCDGQ